ncbi:MAG TPA: peptide deformylase [Cyclobacteriaceae bacterium]|nr:peptide deformylase [Cyclobacteriaceae bacterium]
MVYPIVVYGDPILRKRAKEIENTASPEVQTLIQDMFESMYAAHGIGLAAPQIGKAIRLFVVDGTTLEDEDEDLSGFKKAFINPEIVDETGEPWEFEEGCLSIPNIRENVSRQEKVRIRYTDETGKQLDETYDGMKARIIQHEYDHLNGKMFIDYLTPLKKRMLKGKLTDISKGDVKTEYRILIPKK